MSMIIHRSAERGYFDYGWLRTNHSFSFANFYDPQRMGFGKLRVLNDDFVKPGYGFGMHPHDNMEIISIPLAGDLLHKDNYGNTQIIKTGDVQIMSAGSGIMHSEFNYSEEEPVNFLQIWIFPDKLNKRPEYSQISFDEKEFENNIRTIVAPEKNNDVLFINQDAYLSIGTFGRGSTVTYKINSRDNGVYVFLIDGKLKISGNTLNKRDAAGIYGQNTVKAELPEKSRILFIEIPMGD